MSVEVRNAEIDDPGNSTYRAHRARPSLGARYWQLWAASTGSALGDGVAFVAFPLLAAGVTRQPALIAGIAMAQRLPWLLVSLPAGALADRVDRRRLMSGIDTFRMALLFLLAAAATTGHVTLPLLYAGAFLLGAVDTAYSGAAHAATPALVGRDALDRANGYLFSAKDGGENLAGPALGGVLFAVAAALPLFLDGVSFLFSAVLIFLALRPASGATTRPLAIGTRSRITADVREGLRFYVRSRALRVLSVVIGGLAVCQAMVMSVLVLYGLEVLHLSKAGYGVFLGIASIGHVCGGVVAERVRRRFSTATILTLGAVVAGGAYAGLGATHTAGVACLMLFVEAVIVACGNVASVSFRQRVVPDELLGRVGNAFRMVIWGAIPLGALAGGLIAGQWGLPATFFVAAVVQCGLAGITARALRRELRAGETIDLRTNPREAPSDAPVAVPVPVPAVTA